MAASIRKRHNDKFKSSFYIHVPVLSSELQHVQKQAVVPTHYGLLLIFNSKRIKE